MTTAKPRLRRVPGSIGVLMGRRICYPPVPRPTWCPARLEWTPPHCWRCEGYGVAQSGATVQEACDQWWAALPWWRRWLVRRAIDGERRRRQQWSPNRRMPEALPPEGWIRKGAA